MNMANDNIKMRILPKMPKRHIYQKILKIRALIEMENNCKYQKSKLTKNTKYTKKKQQFNTSFQFQIPCSKSVNLVLDFLFTRRFILFLNEVGKGEMRTRAQLMYTLLSQIMNSQIDLKLSGSVKIYFKSKEFYMQIKYFEIFGWYEKR